MIYQYWNYDLLVLESSKKAKILKIPIFMFSGSRASKKKLQKWKKSSVTLISKPPKHIFLKYRFSNFWFSSELDNGLLRNSLKSRKIGIFEN